MDMITLASSGVLVSWEDGLVISGVGPEGVAIPELGIAPLVDSGTDLQDELSTPDDSPSMSTIRPEEVVLPGARPAPPDVIDFVLETSPLREGAGSPILDVLPSYISSPAGSEYGPASSPVSPSFREDDVSVPP